MTNKNQKDDDKEEEEEEEEEENDEDQQPSTNIRTEFPETWIWFEKNIG